MSDVRYRIDSPLVAMQLVEGEAVLISFETGAYYSARGVGAEILSLLTESRSHSDIEECLAVARADGPSDAWDVAGFLQLLAEEGLVVTEGPRLGAEPQPPARGRTSNGSGIVPSLEKFSDLEDLLLLDPIHDSDVAGWPVARPAHEGEGS